MADSNTDEGFEYIMRILLWLIILGLGLFGLYKVIGYLTG
jgi:hypothetical protein